ncbi:MAG: hypothetical protein GF311_00280 [Candidatus Lokiarchaeota archaeon]|nr:hypothetical protein [Candidatus Lokiarchaeota archaeon]
MPGNLEKRISRGAHTISFLKKNFTKRNKYKDIIYISANPYVSKYLSNSFYKLIPAWKEGWNQKEKTVLPEYMLNITKQIVERYPNKKFIIHFMQPHYPYIRINLGKKDQESNFINWYSARIYKSMALDQHLVGYMNNLRIALKYVNKLISLLKGKIIITSDHGEAFGEWVHSFIPIKFYGHRIGVRIPATIEIPWLVVNKSKMSLESSENEKEKIISKINELRKVKKI